jgi:hypothetical protein
MEIESRRRDGGNTRAVIDCGDVVYNVFFTVDAEASFSKLDTYVVNRNGAGLIRHDHCVMSSIFFWGGPYSVFYGSAK